MSARAERLQSAHCTGLIMRTEQGNNRGRAYILTNQVDPSFPRQLLPYFLASLLAVWAVYAYRFARSSPRGFSTLVETTRSCNASLMILLVCPPIAALSMAGPSLEWKMPIFTLVLIASVVAIGGTVGYRWTRSEVGSGEQSVTRRHWLIGLLGISAAAVGYAATMSHFSILNLHGFIVPSFDLAIYDNLLWNTSHGHFLGSSLIKGGTHMAAHFDPLLVALAPFYLLSPRAETLLIIQSVWLASGAIPLYLIASRILRGAAAGAVVAGAYLLHPALHGINLYEFHSLPLVVPLVIWCLYFLERDNAKGYWVALLLILLTREDMALLACGIGLFAADGRGGPRRGLTTIGCALLYFALVKAFVMAESGVFMSGTGGGYSYRYYFEQMIPHEGGGAREFLLTLLTNPIFALRVVLEEAKLIYLALILLPCCFLPLLARRGWQLLGYGFVFCLLSSVPGPHSLYTQYGSVLLPFAMVLTPLGLSRLSGSALVAALGLEPRRVRCALLVSVAIAVSLVSWKFGAFVENQAFKVGDLWRPMHFRLAEARTEEVWAQYESAMRAIELIPPTASVFATRYLMPLVSNREEVRNPHHSLQTDYWLLRLKQLSEAELARSQSSRFEEVYSGEGVVLLKRVIDAEAGSK
jgi:uncharacterized membrane protein